MKHELVGIQLQQAASPRVRPGTDSPPIPTALEKLGGCVLDGGGFKRRGLETPLRDEKKGARGEVSHFFAWRQAGRGALHRCYSLISGGGGGNNPQRPSKKRTFLFFFPKAHYNEERRGKKTQRRCARERAHQKVRRRGNGPHFCTCTHPDMRVVYVYTLCISVCYNIPLL